MMKFSIISAMLALLGTTLALPAPQSSSVDTSNCINQASGQIYIDFENIDVERGSSFMVKIGNLNTGNIASNFAGSSSVSVDQTSGDIFVVFDDIQVDMGSTFSVNIGNINTGNLAIANETTTDIPPPPPQGTPKPPKPSKRYVPPPMVY